LSNFSLVQLFSPPTFLSSNLSLLQLLSFTAINSLYTSSVLGFLCVLGFILLRPHVRFYEARRYIRGVSVRPPPLSHRGALARAASWLVPVFSVPDAELVRSAGLDALMVHRTLSFGLLFFSPLAVVGCAVLLPLYATAGGSTTSSSSSPSSSAASSARVQKLAQLALGNLPPGSRAQLVPFFFCVAALVYGCWLLDVFLKEFVLLRQMYLSTGEAAGALAAAAAAVRSEARKGSRGGPANEAAAAAAESSSSAAPNDAAEEGGGLLTWEAIAAAVAPDPGVIRIGDGQPAPRVAPPAPPSSPPPRLCSPGLLLPSHIPVPLRKTLPIVFPGHPRSRLVAVGADLFAALAFDVPPPPPRVKKAARQEAKATAAAAAAAAAATAATAEPAAAGRTKSSAGSWRRGWMLAGFGGASEENAAGGGSDSDSDGDSDGDGIESAVGGVSDDSGDDESSAPRNSSSGRRLCCCSRSVDALGAVAALCAGPLTAPAASGFDGDGDLAISAALQQQVHEAVSEEAALLLAASTSPGARGDGARGGARGAGSVSTSTSEADSSKRQQQQQQQRQRQQQSDVAALGSAAATAARAAFSLRHRRRRRKWGNSNGSSRRYSEGDGGERGEEGEGTTEDGAVAVVVQAPPPPPPPPAKTTTTATTTTTTTAAAAPSLARRRRTPLPCPDAAPEAWFAAASRLGGQDLVDAVFSRVAGGRAWGGDGFGVVVVGGAAAAGGASKGFYLGSVPVRDHRKAHAALEALEKARARLRKAETEAAEVKREQEEEEEEEEEEKDDDEEQKRRSSPSSASSRRAAKRLAAASDAVDAATEQLREAERAVEEAQREALREEERGDEGAAQDSGSDRKAPRERPPHPSAFIALFSTPAAASAVASVPLFPQGWRRSFRVARAPGADEVCWQALWISPARRRRGRALAFCWLAFFVGLPVGIFAGALANLEHAACSAQDAAAAAAALASSGGGGEPSAAPQQAAGGLRGLFCGRSSFARSLVTGTLPPVLVALWSCLVMPKALLRGVLLASSDRSLSAVDARVCRLFFAWTFFNVSEEFFLHFLFSSPSLPVLFSHFPQTHVKTTLSLSLSLISSYPLHSLSSLSRLSPHSLSSLSPLLCFPLSSSPSLHPGDRRRRPRGQRPAPRPLAPAGPRQRLPRRRRLAVQRLQLLRQLSRDAGLADGAVQAAVAVLGAAEGGAG